MFNGSQVNKYTEKKMIQQYLWHNKFACILNHAILLLKDRKSIIVVFATVFDLFVTM